MTLNAWSKKIHENAVAHGWWENERTFAEVVSLFHSELSEALEEFRAKRPMLYFPCKQNNAVCDEYVKFENEEERAEYSCVNAFKSGEPCEYISEKPEGIAVELVDCVIRILDYLGHEDTDIDQTTTYDGIWDAEKEANVDLPEAVANLHYIISMAYEIIMNKTGESEKYLICERNRYLCAAIKYIRKWLELHGENMEKIMLIKHEYNRTRDYRHGGKAL